MDLLDSMDPGAILAILESSRKALSIALRLKDAFSGDESSRRKLEALTGRLAIIKATLARIVTIPDFLDSHPYALDGLRRTIEDCNHLLDRYAHITRGSSARGTLQIAQLALMDQETLVGLNDRLSHHAGDLSLLQISDINFSMRRESALDVRALQVAPRPDPQRSSTLLTDYSGVTLAHNYDDPQSQFARPSPFRSSPERGQELEVPLGTSPGSSNVDPLDNGSLGHYQLAQTNPWYNEVSPSSTVNQTAVRRVPSRDLPITAPNTTASPPGLVPNSLPASLYSSSESGTSAAAGRVKVLTLGETYVFTADNYTVSTGDGARVVEWYGDGCYIKHAVPLDYTGVPFTRPFDRSDDRKENHLRFMSPGSPHQLLIITNQQGTDVQKMATLSQYVFTSRRERQRFQEEIRGAYKMQSFRGLSVTTSLKPGKHIARDVNVKIWTFNDRRSTISFARNLGDDRQKWHEEINLSCFEDYKGINNNRSTVTLVVRKTDGTPEPPPVSSSRRDSFRMALSGLSPSRRSSANSVASATSALDSGEPPPPLPPSIGKIEWLKLEFEDKKGIRGDFCRCWTEAYRRNPRNSPSLPLPDAWHVVSTAATEAPAVPLWNPSSPGAPPQTSGSRPGSMTSSPVMTSPPLGYPSPRAVDSARYHTMHR